MLKTRFALVAVALYSGIFVEQSIASPLTSAEVTKIINRVSVIEPAKGDRPAALRDVIKEDRKSTRLNSSHDQISYAVFCLKKKKPPHSRRAFFGGLMDTRRSPRPARGPSSPRRLRALVCNAHGLPILDVPVLYTVLLQTAQ